MTPSMHVGFSNGVPTEEERRTIERQLNQKFSGSGNAGKILITFNDGKETQPIIEPIQMNDAQSAWEGMSKQAVSQILAGHRVTSPILFGIRSEGGGLGNNADELRDAYSLFNNTVIIPFQNILLKGLGKIFKVNDINLDLYFKTLKPADFIDLEVTQTQSEEDQEKEGLEWRKEDGRGGTQGAVARARAIINGDLSLDTISRMNSFFARHEVDKKADGVSPGEDGFPSAGRIAWALWGGDAGQSWAKKKVEEIKNVRADLSDDEFNGVFDSLKGEEIDLQKWEIVDEQEEGLIEDYEDWADALIEKLDKEKFADAIESTPDVFSVLDKSFYKVRFKYFKKSTRKNKTGTSRTFCENMMRESQKGTVYRIEDIDFASRDGVNKEFGHNGKKYDLFRYKGGPYCMHAWKAVLYRLKSNSVLRDTAIQPLDDYKNVSSIPKTYAPNPRGIKESKEAANKGNNWWKYPGSKN